MLRIYFGEKPLFIGEDVAKGLQEFSSDEVVQLTKLSEDRVSYLIKQMEITGVKAGIIPLPEDEVLLAIKRQFLYIQAAGGLAYNQQNQILLIFRRGKWDLPKGKLDDGEDLADCAVREVQEETGLHSVILQQPLATTYHTYHQDKEHVLKESTWYLMKADEKELLTPQIDEDIEQCLWVDLEQVNEYMKNTHPSIKDVVAAGLRKLSL
ncbi:MAG TPA: NUDIX domain-containing protein [Chitinophagaceae bacterium]|jgi:ADP-ribose pyrophosphatase YjhB (NUDIX family)|nr:NUDIX domain-containing protein [Chitinophagaceae bacterium]